MVQIKYKTRQRQVIYDCVQQHAGEFLTVDEIYELLLNQGEEIGRTTVYRTLEKLHQDNLCSKVSGHGGTAAKYMCARQSGELEHGRLYCLSCGSVETIDCKMLTSFEQHVRKHHGFRVDESAAVIYGTCQECLKKEERE